MLYIRAPLAFLDVDRGHYAEAMVGVYERQDVSLAVDLFDGTYRRSCAKYAVVLEAMSAPPLLREELRKLEAFNCARYRVTMGATEAWIAAGRPA
jgi:hypothetical protein